MKEVFVTANQKLEQFLFMHRIFFTSYRKNEDLMTEWTYERTPALDEVVNEFRRIYSDAA